MSDARLVSEVYADIAQISAGGLGVFMGFYAVDATELFSVERGETEGRREDPFDLKAIVRLSHEDAKIFTIFLKRALKVYEEEAGEILLPQGFAEGIELAADEW